MACPLSFILLLAWLRRSMMNVKRVLAVGDGVAATGFSRVMHNILGNVNHQFEIHHLGTNYHGDPHDYAWKIYPAKNGGDLQGVMRLPNLVKEVKPDLIFILNDIWVVRDYVKQLQKHSIHLPVVVYCPIDGGPLDEDVVAGLEGVTRFVVYTKFAKKEMDRALEKIRVMNLHFVFPAIEVIPHGIDTDVFNIAREGQSPCVDVLERSEAISTLYGDASEFDEAFIVLNANRNQPRKRIDITMQGFSEFSKDKPENVKLHLHMGVEDMGWNIIKLAKRFGIYDRIIITANNNNIPSVSDSQLRLIYRAASVGVNTSVGEGWGLVSFEHAATGAAQIVPRHSACAELWEGSALLLEPRFHLLTEHLLTDQWLVSYQDLAESLEALYSDKEHLRSMSEAAFKLACKDEYQWGNIAERWGRLFDDAMHGGNIPGANSDK